MRSLRKDPSCPTLEYQNWRGSLKKSCHLQPRLLYPAKLSFRTEGQLKSLPDKKKLKEFVITASLYEMSKELI